MTLELFSLAGKTALVTGGSQGIGLMISRGLVQAGAKVFVSSRKANACEAAAAELAEFGDCEALPGDVSTPAGIAALVADLQQHTDKLHIVVNNAGTGWAAPLEDYPDSAWDKVLGLNVKAPFNLTVACLPLLRSAASHADPARVINLGSIEGFRTQQVENYAYATSKAANHHLTRILAQRLAPEQITVNTIAPGPFPSKMMAVEFEQRQDVYEAANPMGRVGQPDDMAGIAIFLASKASSYITGQVIAVDGGFSTAPW